MKVLVTGGAGFIGSNLVKALVEQGDTVTVLDDLSSGCKKNLPPLSALSFIEGDIRDAGLVNQCMSKTEVVYHLAASVGNKRSIDYPLLDAEINALGTLTLLEAARHHQVKKFVLSSSAGIFGELKTLPIHEDHPVEPRTPYAASKLYAEKIALSYADLYGMEVVCLRYFNVYGPQQRFDAYGNVIPIFVFNMLEGRPLTVFGDGEQTRDFVNVADIVQANRQAAAQSGLTGVFNIASGTQITINQLLNELKRFSRAPLNISYREKRAGDVRHSLADIRAAQKAFGYQPHKTLSQGLKEYVDWAAQELNSIASATNQIPYCIGQ